MSFLYIPLKHVIVIFFLLVIKLDSSVCVCVVCVCVAMIELILMKGASLRRCMVQHAIPALTQ